MLLVIVAVVDSFFRFFKIFLCPDFTGHSPPQARTPWNRFHPPTRPASVALKDVVLKGFFVVGFARLSPFQRYFDKHHVANSFGGKESI